MSLGRPDHTTVFSIPRPLDYRASILLTDRRHGPPFKIIIKVYCPRMCLSFWKREYHCKPLTDCLDEQSYLDVHCLRRHSGSTIS